MSLKIKDISIVPPGNGWEYCIEATGVTIRTRNYNILYPKIVEHCRSNNIPAPSEEDVIKQMCERLYIPCYEGMSPLINAFSLNLPRPAALGSCCKEVKTAPLPKEAI